MIRFVLPLLLVAALPVQAETPPQGFRVVFELESRGTTVAETRWTLEPSGGGTFIYESETNTKGVAALFRKARIVERSELRYQGARPQPLAYSYVRTGHKDRTVGVRFDWEKGIAHNTLRGQTWSMPVPDGTLDKLAYVLALMHDLHAGSLNNAYTVADGGKIKTYQIDYLGEERLDTPLGTLDTLKLRRTRAGNTERETIIWSAPSLGFLPVRLEHREPDGSAILRAVTIERLSADSGTASLN